jgi:hypothetical protein
LIGVAGRFGEVADGFAQGQKVCYLVEIAQSRRQEVPDVLARRLSAIADLQNRLTWTSVSPAAWPRG